MENDKNIAPAVVPEQADQEPRHYPNQPRHHGHHSCWKFFGCFFLMIVIILLCVIFLTVYITGPIVKTVGDLPADFPRDLVLYQANQAQIKVLSPASQQKIQQLSAALPDWALELLTNYLYPDLKTQIMAQNKTPENLPEMPTVKDIKTVSNNKTDKTETVSLFWNNVNKTKEELYSYYKAVLEQKGFTVTELIRSNEIDLSFFKTGIEGAMSLADSFSQDGNSIIKMTVDYLNK